jgi:predicted phosphate transport protein (TIGR00153 family)
MKINSILSVFSPRDVKFFPMLKETSGILMQSATLLCKLFTSANKEEVEKLCRLIKEEEVKGDKVTGRIMKALNETFITPFDREDIDALTDSMDDINDVMNRAAQKVLLYSPKEMPSCTDKLAKIIYKGVVEIQGAIEELENLRKTDVQFRQHYKEIKRLEEKADIVYEEGIIDLFKTDIKTVELIKLKEIIQELENAANKINHTGKVLKTILVKYA